jgi:hypothetical protein
VFDRLFRKHLQNVFLVLGDPVPGELSRPIAGVQAHARAQTEPTSLLNVKIDGRRTYFEWLNAGHWSCGNVRGTMAMAQEGRIADLYFGFDADRLLLRLDTRGGTASERLADIDTLRLAFFEPAGFELLVARPSWQDPILELYHHDVAVSESGVTAAADQVLEIAIPFRSLGAAAEDPIHFCVELLQADRSLERVPNEGAIETAVPSPEFEQMMWQA